jgi:hypothetical protein
VVVGIRADDLDLERWYSSTARDRQPRIPRFGPRIHGVGHDRVADAQVVSGDRVPYEIAGVVDWQARMRRRLTNGVLDRIDTDVDGWECPCQFDGDGRLADAGKARQHNQYGVGGTVTAVWHRGAQEYREARPLRSVASAPDPKQLDHALKRNRLSSLNRDEDVRRTEPPWRLPPLS